MTPEKKILADAMCRKMQIAHIKGIIESHHAPELEQMLTSYHNTFKIFTRSTTAERTPERVRRFMKSEVSAITDILAQCHASDKSATVAKLEAHPSLMDSMPLITDI